MVEVLAAASGLKAGQVLERRSVGVVRVIADHMPDGALKREDAKGILGKTIIKNLDRGEPITRNILKELEEAPTKP